MGNINCSQFCQGPEHTTELDLKRSIVQTFIHARKSCETLETLRQSIAKPLQQTHQSNQASESTIPESKLDSFAISLNQQRENSAKQIQQAWRIYYNVKQYLQFRSYRQPNHDYFSYEYNRETASPATGLLKRKKRSTYTYPNGATYKGEWVGGFRDGDGVMTWPDGSAYNGEWSYGYPFGVGVFTFKGQSSYEGEWRSPYAYAKKSKTSDDDGYLWLYQQCKQEKAGPKYSSDHLKRLKNLEKNFNAIVESMEDPKKFVENLFDTKFSKKFKEYTYDGNVKYYGEMKGKMRDGKGRNIWGNGDTYAGLWANDKQNGIGRNLWIDGSMYTGGYKDNLKDGIGEYTWVNGTKYVGEWKDNLIHGIGKYSYADGKEYLGEWANGKRNGFGVFTWPDGKKYAGGWLDNKKNGTGYSTNENGRVSKDKWSNGKIVK